jgi:S1-C subfamily serine protease
VTEMWRQLCVLNSHFRSRQLFTYPLGMNATNATAAVQNIHPSWFDWITVAAIIFRRYAFISVLTASCGAFAAAGKAEGDVSVETIARVKHSVVPVVCGFLDAQGTFRVARILGTGFFVDTLGRFLTASHVLDDMEKQKKITECSEAIYISKDGWEKFAETINLRYIAVTQCRRDTKIDLAVCQLVENPFTSLKKGSVEALSFETEEQPDGCPIAFSGFPLQDPFPVTSIGIVAGKGSSADVPGYFDYFVDKAAWPGASGSPVYLANGKVIGLLRSTGLNSGSGLSYARSAKAITDFLAKNPANLPTR